MEHKLEVGVEERYELTQARALSITRTPESRFLRDHPQRLRVKAGIARSPKDRNLLLASALTWLSKIVACSDAGVARMNHVSYLLLAEELRGYGDVSSNAEAMALKRAASKFGLGLSFYQK